MLGFTGKSLIEESYVVETTTLLSFIEAQNLEVVDILKIDVEGHELECLKGLFSDSEKPCPVRFIQLEDHRDDMYGDKGSEVNEFMNLMGFQKTEQVKHGFGNLYDVIWTNTRLA